MAQIKPPFETFARIKVIGCGGSGMNALQRMIQAKIHGVEFIAVNTDAQDLHSSGAPVKIHIGKSLTRGLGAGMNPDIGRQAAEDTKEEIINALKGADMVFIAYGLGGGTGTGAGPIIADLAREVGALTVAVVTKPFSFEGAQRMKIAEDGWNRLRDNVDSLITIPNDRILSIIDRKTPLLEVSIDGAKGVLFNVSGNTDMAMAEISEAAKIITEHIDPEAKVIFGATLDENMKKGEIKVTVIATGFSNDGMNLRPATGFGTPSQGLFDNDSPKKSSIPT